MTPRSTGRLSSLFEEAQSISINKLDIFTYHLVTCYTLIPLRNLRSSEETVA